jgi:anti-sigma factor RsiW
MLPLAAAGALGRAEISRVERHLAACSGCRRELEILRLYSRGLGELPQPIVPAGLLQRTKARLIQERDTAADHRRQGLVLGLLTVFSWSIAGVFWLLVRAVTGGVWEVLGANLADGVTWFSVSALLAWATAGVAAVVLGKRHKLARRPL